MASFSMGKEFEVKEAVDSPTIIRLRSLADDGKVEAFSLKLRHPRFKERFTAPHFYALFSVGGRRYAEDAESLNGLNSILEQDYLAAPSPVKKPTSGASKFSM